MEGIAPERTAGTLPCVADTFTKVSHLAWATLRDIPDALRARNSRCSLARQFSSLKSRERGRHAYLGLNAHRVCAEQRLGRPGVPVNWVV